MSGGNTSWLEPEASTNSSVLIEKKDTSEKNLQMHHKELTIFSAVITEISASSMRLVAGCFR